MNRKMDLEKIKEHLQGFCIKEGIQIGFPGVELLSKTLVPLGHLGDEILKAAEGEPCEVIVLGAHGKRFWAHTSLGSKDRSAL
jgi:nucleotide-binding universal stress UspA family protein